MREKHSSPGLALLDALNATATTGGSPGDDIANLCSGKFPDTFSSQLTRREPTSDTPTQDISTQDSTFSSSSSSSAKEDDLLVPPSQHPFTKTIDSRLNSKSATPSSISEDSICLSQERLSAKMSGKESSGQRSSAGEGCGSVGDEDNAVWRWAQRHQSKVMTPNATMSQQSAVVVEENAEIAGSIFDDDDEDMPMIRRRKLLVHQTKA